MSEAWSDPAEAGRYSRADLLRYAVAGGAGLALLGGAAPLRGLRLLDSEAATPPKPTVPTVHAFVSQPSLRPPIISVLRSKPGGAPGLLFLAPSSGPGARGVMIADSTGAPVFFHTTAPNTAMDFRPGLYKGAPVLTWWEGRHVQGVGKVGHYVVMDASYKVIARLSAGNGRNPDFHEVLLTDRNTLLVTVYEAAAANLTRVGGRSNGKAYGGVIQELELPSGKVLWEWRSLDHVGIEESVQTEIGNPYDYFHINSIEVAPDGNLLVSARNTSAIYKIDRASGEVIWRLGGTRSDFTMGKGTPFGFQHDARFHDGENTVTLFDNGPDPGQKTPESRAITLRLDHTRKTATLAREIRHTAALYARVTGNHQVLPGGDQLVTWGSTGWFSEYAPDGSLRLDAKLPEGGQNYRVYRQPWVGRPTTAPALAASTGAGTRKLYASWNGSTEHASWQLLAGARAGSLTAASGVPRTGFETALTPPAGTRYAQVVALDKAGKQLGRSKVIAL